MTERQPRAEVDGFELGLFVCYGTCGDAWITAPDGSSATLIWETGEDRSFDVVIEPNDPRRGERWAPSPYDSRSP